MNSSHPRGQGSGRGRGRGRDGRGGGRPRGRQAFASPGSPRKQNGDAPKFKTDADISKPVATADVSDRDRKLERWQIEGEDVGTLEHTQNDTWDQFEVNKNKFGVQSTFDEHLYTTAIDVDHPEYKDRVKRAEKLAREIEGQSTSNVHLAEDRGQQLEAEVDEEDLFSGVARNPVDNLKAQEKSDRAADDREFAARHRRSKSKNKSPERKAKQEQSGEKPKKKFNFSAAAAKSTSFTPGALQQQPQFYVPMVPQGWEGPYVDQYGMMQVPYMYPYPQ